MAIDRTDNVDLARTGDAWMAELGRHQRQEQRDQHCPA
jgi:hypothetical protein